MAVRCGPGRCFSALLPSFVLSADINSFSPIIWGEKLQARKKRGGGGGGFFYWSFFPFSLTPSHTQCATYIAKVVQGKLSLGFRAPAWENEGLEGALLPPSLLPSSSPSHPFLFPHFFSYLLTHRSPFSSKPISIPCSLPLLHQDEKL